MRTGIVVTGASVVSAALGAAATYALMKKHFDELVSYEIAEFKAQYAERMESQIIQMETAKHNELAKGEIDLAVDEAAEIAKAEGYIPVGEAVMDSIEEHRNIFDNPQTNWDQATEEANRDELPYIISQREFSESQLQRAYFTYFGGDDVTVDQDDDVIGDVEEIVGDRALQSFGHGSNDPNVVYVRNDGIETDFQITYNPGTYEAGVLGYIEHSERTAPRKFRTWDE